MPFMAKQLSRSSFRTYAPQDDMRIRITEHDNRWHENEPISQRLELRSFEGLGTDNDFRRVAHYIRFDLTSAEHRLCN